MVPNLSPQVLVLVPQFYIKANIGYRYKIIPWKITFFLLITKSVTFSGNGDFFKKITIKASSE